MKSIFILGLMFLLQGCFSETKYAIELPIIKKNKVLIPEYAKKSYFQDEINKKLYVGHKTVYAYGCKNSNRGNCQDPYILFRKKEKERLRQVCKNNYGYITIGHSKVLESEIKNNYNFTKEKYKPRTVFASYGSLSRAMKGQSYLTLTSVGTTIPESLNHYVCKNKNKDIFYYAMNENSYIDVVGSVVNRNDPDNLNPWWSMDTYIYIP